MPPSANVKALQVVQELSYHQSSCDTPVTDNTRLPTSNVVDVNPPHLTSRVEEENKDCHHSHEDRNDRACYHHLIYKNKASLQISPAKRRGGMPHQISFPSLRYCTSPSQATSASILRQSRTSSICTDKCREEELKIIYGKKLDKGSVEVVLNGHPLHHSEDNSASSLEPNCPLLNSESEKREVEAVVKRFPLHHHHGSDARSREAFSSAPNLTLISCFSRKRLHDSMPSMVLNDYSDHSNGINDCDIKNDIFMINHHHQNKQIVAQHSLSLHSSAAFQRKRRRWRRRMLMDNFKYLAGRMVPPPLKGQKRKAYNLEPSCGCLT